jgi:hypothetical protein
MIELAKSALVLGFNPVVVGESSLIGFDLPDDGFLPSFFFLPNIEKITALFLPDVGTKKLATN